MGRRRLQQSGPTAGWAGLASWEQMTRLQIGIRVPDLAPLRTPPRELHNHTHGRGGCQDATIDLALQRAEFLAQGAVVRFAN
jgi:hypothetical protein